MAADQLAVARPFQPLAPKRQGGIPQFLDKLYHMVEDPNTELIKWSDDGDSFVVTDQEKFSKEVLGRWFKHQNFGSFVRQLNLYGFRKVPNLQQGALHGDTSEPLCFENTNFHRGQPDLLQLISRKKQAVAGRDDGTVDKAAATGSTAARVVPTSATHMDVNSLLNGIAAIKRHQTTISTELTELKRSNQALWQEAITSRERYQRQQDTVDRILKFLGSVFGVSPTGASQSQAATPTPSASAGIRRRPKRLMIENVGESKQDNKESPRFVEHSSPQVDEDDDDMEALDDVPDRPPHGTVSSIASPVTSILTPFSTRDVNLFEDQLGGGHSQPAGQTSTTASTPAPLWSDVALGGDLTDPSSSSALPTLGTAPSDPVMNSFLTNLLNKPSELQKVMSAMHSLTPPTAPQEFNFSSSGGDMVLAQNGFAAPASQQPQYSFANWPQMQDSAIAPFETQLPVADPSITSAEGLFQPLAADQQHFQVLENATTNLDSHIDAMDSSLHSIMQTFGLPAAGTAYPSHYNSQDPGLDPSLDFDLGADSGHGFGADDSVDWKVLLEQMEDSTKAAPAIAHTKTAVDTGDSAVPATVPSKRKAEPVSDPTATKSAKRSNRKK